MKKTTAQVPTGITAPAGAKKLTPLDMNKLPILKDHTVITFTH